MELKDVIYAELEAKLGREATLEEYGKVAEWLPEFVSRQSIAQIVGELNG